jgi:hypothetical protein
MPSPMAIKISTPAEYIKELSAEQKPLVKKLRALVRKHLPTGYVETMRWGMICYEIPLKVCPDTYNKQPLMYAAIGAQKHHVGVYLCGLYAFEDIRKPFVKAWKKTGTKLDMGKSCIRLKAWEQCEPELIAEVIASVPVDEFIKRTRAVQKKPRKNRAK